MGDTKVVFVVVLDIPNLAVEVAASKPGLVAVLGTANLAVAVEDSKLLPSFATLVDSYMEFAGSYMAMDFAGSYMAMNFAGSYMEMDYYKMMVRSFPKCLLSRRL